MLASGAFAALLLGLGGGEIGAATRRTATRWLPRGRGRTHIRSGGEVVAESSAAGLLAGGAEALDQEVLFPAVSPVLAALGGALTGSNAASNALFMPLQVEAARGLGISEMLTAAVQNVAGSHASMLAPRRMVSRPRPQACWAEATSCGSRSPR